MKVQKNYDAIKWRDSARIHAVIEPTFWERIAILFGKPIRVQTTVYTQLILGRIHKDVQVYIPSLSNDQGDLGFIEHNKEDIKDAEEVQNTA
jgi:hypothetical protein